jgi:hypothetical protein
MACKHFKLYFQSDILQLSVSTKVQNSLSRCIFIIKNINILQTTYVALKLGFSNKQWTS